MKKSIIYFLSIITIFCTGCIQKNDDSRSIVDFASWGSQSEVEILKTIISDFEIENPDIKINFMHIPQNYFQKIHLLLASNTAPDIIFINNLNIPVYEQYLEDLSSIINKNDYYKKTLDALSYNNKLLAVPRDVSTIVIYYNKDLFKKYNIKFPDKNWTFNDLLKISLEFKKHNIYGISFEEESICYLPYLMSEGGGILSDDLKTEIVNLPQSQKGIQFYSDLRNKYNVAPKKSQSASLTMAQMFLQEKIAMHVSGRWMVPKYRESAKFDWDVINFPNGDKGSVVPLDASGWAVYKFSKNKSNAFKFIEYVSSKNISEKFAKTGLMTPARIDASNSESFLSGKPKSSKIFLDIIKTSKPTPVSKHYNELVDKVNLKLEPIFDKE